MSGLYNYAGIFDAKYSNNTNGHFSGNFTDPTGAVTGCIGMNCPSQNLNMREATDMKQTGGQGYGISPQQHIAGFDRVPEQTSYPEVGINSDGNLAASKQFNPSTQLHVIKGGRKHRKIKGGSGYSPITIGSQSGGRRHRSKKLKSHKRSRHSMRHKRTKHKLSRTRKGKHHRTHRKLGLRRKKTSNLLKRLIGRQSGGYSQFMGDQAFSQGYELGGPVTPSTSALANPIPIKPYNNCSDPFRAK